MSQNLGEEINGKGYECPGSGTVLSTSTGLVFIVSNTSISIWYSIFIISERPAGRPGRVEKRPNNDSKK